MPEAEGSVLTRINKEIQTKWFLPIDFPTKLGEGGGGSVYKCYRLGSLKAVETFMDRCRVDKNSSKDLYFCALLSDYVTDSTDIVGALKMPHSISDQRALSRLQREISAMAEFSGKHPNLIRMVDYGILPNGHN